MLKGLPGSGKTTYALMLAKKPGWKRVNKDELRALIDGGVWSQGSESMILTVRDFIIRQALTAGYNVVVDDTNLASKHETTLAKIAEGMQVNFDVSVFNTPLQVCIERDKKRPNPVGEKVIREMHERYLHKLEQ